MINQSAIRQILLDMQAVLTGRLNKTQAEEREQVETAGPRDNAHLWEESDIRDGLDDEAAAELRDVSRALVRLDSGDYGLCTKCGEAISSARLQAVPYAELCISCADGG